MLHASSTVKVRRGGARATYGHGPRPEGGGCYLLPLPELPGVLLPLPELPGVLLPLSVDPEGGVAAGGGVGVRSMVDGGVIEGDADGRRSDGLSPTLPVSDSVHATARPPTSR